ncbi:MAG: ABC transporter ATP-binding protein [Vicinamibacterales bacterium]|nr:ABC transporter ATP-binding protein [Vicinamibacterales bacterium]
MSSNVVLSIEDLSVVYSTPRGMLPAVRNVSFSIHEGEAFGLVGESGSGKSTISLAVMRYLADNGLITSGKITFLDKDILTLDPDELRILRGNRVSLVYQDPMTALNPSLTIGHQINEVFEQHRNMSKRDARRASLTMLEKVHMPDPEDVALRYPHQLSGGQQQRVVIAMALSCDPGLLIMDEPTTGLDVTTEAHILDLVQELKQEFHAAILYITHNLGVIAKIADRVGVIYAGELVEHGPTRTVFGHPRHPYTEGLMTCIPRIEGTTGRGTLRPIGGNFPDLTQPPSGCIFHPRCRYRQDECGTTEVDLFEVTNDHRASCLFWNELELTTFGSEESETHQVMETGGTAPAGQSLLSMIQVTKHYGGLGFLERITGSSVEKVKAVDGVSLDIAPGEALGLVGESGCGKSTIGRTILKLHSLTSGNITFDGQDIWGFTGRSDREYRRQVQIVFQNPDSSLNPRKRITEILQRPLLLYKINQDDPQRRAQELLELVQLEAWYLDRYPHELSGGEKQRVGIARAFAAQPRFIVLDEPVSALDVSVQASILNLLLDLQRQFQTSYLFISHDLSVVRYICHRVAVMYLGKLCEVGPVEKIFAPPFHPYTEALLSAAPRLSFAVEEVIRLEGSVPSAKNPPTGCRFHTRCPRFIGDICVNNEPKPIRLSDSHVIACHHFS